jgi:hypothetical protein
MWHFSNGLLFDFVIKSTSITCLFAVIGGPVFISYDLSFVDNNNPITNSSTSCMICVERNTVLSLPFYYSIEFPVIDWDLNP